MPHVDPDVLALVALGEEVADDAERAHLATCPECSGEVESLASTVAVGRSVTPADSLVLPPPDVWQRIRGELDLSPVLEPDGAAPVPVPTPDAEVVDLAGRRRGAGAGGRAAWIAGAAAAGVAIGAVGTSWWSEQGPTNQPAVLAQADLEALPGWEASGAAVVEVADDGTVELVIDLEGADELGGYREVWLIDREVTRLVSLGVLEGSSGRFTVPADLDLSEFPVVDVSDEPFDGDPAHSGDSIIRGLLDT